MTPVGEEDMIRYDIVSFPAEPFVLFCISSDLFLFRALSDWFFVALHARGYRGHAGKGLIFEEGMAGVAFQPLLFMFLVIKRNRLISF